MNQYKKTARKHVEKNMAAIENSLKPLDIKSEEIKNTLLESYVDILSLAIERLCHKMDAEYFKQFEKGLGD